MSIMNFIQISVRDHIYPYRFGEITELNEDKERLQIIEILWDNLQNSFNSPLFSKEQAESCALDFYFEEAAHFTRGNFINTFEAIPKIKNIFRKTQNGHDSGYSLTFHQSVDALEHALAIDFKGFKISRQDVETRLLDKLSSLEDQL